jgi:ubiquinone/menaquinone biosynthesis C-methylase UbiE
MERLKLRQREIYEKEAIEIDSLKVDLDKFGFTYGIRLKEIKLKRLLSLMNIHPKKNVLDIGCGDGRFLNKLNAQYKTLKNIGIDISLRQLRFNLRNNPFGNLYCLSDAEELPFQDSYFDYVFCFDVLEHLPNPKICIKEILRVLKPRGKALIYALNRKDKYTWHWFLRIISFGKLGIDRGYWGEHDKENFLVTEDIIKECKDNRLNINRIVYFHSFFTLIFDEVYPRLLNFIYSKLLKIRSTKEMRTDTQDNFNVTNSTNSKIILFLIKICSYLNNLILIFLEFVDKLWAKKGYSNGFFVLVEKWSYRE